MSSVVMVVSQKGPWKDVKGWYLHQICAGVIISLAVKSFLGTGSPWYPMPGTGNKTEQLGTRKQKVENLGEEK